MESPNPSTPSKPLGGSDPLGGDDIMPNDIGKLAGEFKTNLRRLVPAPATVEQQAAAAVFSPAVCSRLAELPFFAAGVASGKPERWALENGQREILGEVASIYASQRLTIDPGKAAGGLLCLLLGIFAVRPALEELEDWRARRRAEGAKKDDPSKPSA